jgi:hypothetical protein
MRHVAIRIFIVPCRTEDGDGGIHSRYFGDAVTCAWIESARNCRLTGGDAAVYSKSVARRTHDAVHSLRDMPKMRRAVPPRRGNVLCQQQVGAVTRLVVEK